MSDRHGRHPLSIRFQASLRRQSSAVGPDRADPHREGGRVLTDRRWPQPGPAAMRHWFVTDGTDFLLILLEVAHQHGVDRRRPDRSSSSPDPSGRHIRMGSRDGTPLVRSCIGRPRGMALPGHHLARGRVFGAQGVRGCWRTLPAAESFLAPFMCWLLPARCRFRGARARPASMLEAMVDDIRRCGHPAGGVAGPACWTRTRGATTAGAASLAGGAGTPRGALRPGQMIGLHRWPVAAGQWSWGRPDPRGVRKGGKQPRQRRDGPAPPDGPGSASRTERRTSARTSRASS